MNHHDMEILTLFRHKLICSVVFWIVSLAINSNHLLANDALERWNVLFILADDLGVHDVGCYGTDLIETPHIDRFAQTSLRFTQAYSPAPVCTPTRASIMTGKHPARLKMTIWSEGALEFPKDRMLIPAYSKADLPLEENTLAEHYQQAGYYTASIGKWHLGDAGHAPETQGFDANIGGNHWGAPTSFFFPYRGKRNNGEIRYVPHLEFGNPQEYLTDRLTEETLKVIGHAKSQQLPFFIMLNHYAPHTPIDCKADDENYFQSKLQSQFKHQNCGYAAMIRSLDDSIGRLVDYLDKEKLLENTIIVFTSDNGGYIGRDPKRNSTVTSNWPLRSGKSSLYEGGLRVPLLIRWPKTASLGKTYAEPVVLTDLHPTLLASLPERNQTTSPSSPNQLDGINLQPAITQNTTLTREALYFHYPHYYHAPATTPCSAIRQGPWKLIHYYESDSNELYHLLEDPAEERNVADKYPQVSQKLQAQLQSWLQEVEAEQPTRNKSK